MLTLKCSEHEDNGTYTLVLDAASHEALLKQTGVTAADTSFGFSADFKQVTYSITINDQVQNLVFKP